MRAAVAVRVAGGLAEGVQGGGAVQGRRGAGGNPYEPRQQHAVLGAAVVALGVRSLLIKDPRTRYILASPPRVELSRGTWESTSFFLINSPVASRPPLLACRWFGDRSQGGQREIWQAVQDANAQLEFRRTGPKPWWRCCYDTLNATQCGVWKEGGNEYPNTTYENPDRLALLT